ncbi:unnamed protein product [Effrenium voratum]|nr:unnamed protein product [Effrenium voratum]
MDASRRPGAALAGALGGGALRRRGAGPLPRGHTGEVHPAKGGLLRWLRHGAELPGAAAPRAADRGDAAADGAPPGAPGAPHRGGGCPKRSQRALGGAAGSCAIAHGL